MRNKNADARGRYGSSICEGKSVHVHMHESKSACARAPCAPFFDLPHSFSPSSPSLSQDMLHLSDDTVQFDVYTRYIKLAVFILTRRAAALAVMRPTLLFRLEYS